MVLRSRPKEEVEDDSATDQARKLKEEDKSGPPDQEDPRPSTLCQSIGSCAGEAAKLAAKKPEDDERKSNEAAPKNSAPERDAAADEAKPTPVAHDGGREAEWYGADWSENKSGVRAWQSQHYPSVTKYQDFAKWFTAKKFVPADWADLFDAAGAKYVVLTTKHHDGYALWPSKKLNPNWNSMEVGPAPGRDLVGELAKATRAKKLKFGVYHSLFEWWHPDYLQDKQNNWSTKKFSKEKTIPELHDLMERYKPSLIWSDGQWEAPTDYWTSREFLAWLYNESPVKDEIVVNDRWGRDTTDRHGGYYSGDDRQKPGAERLKHKWESADTVDKGNWGYNKDTPVEEMWTAQELIHRLVRAVAYGGNYLLNVGPTAEGVIIDAFQDRLKSIGSYLSINGEAVYKTRACEEIQEQSGIDGGYYTAKPDQKLVYLHVVPSHGSWPNPGSTLQLTGVKSVDSVHLLTADGPTEVKCTENEGHVQCKTPTRDEGTTHKNGFALKLKGAVMQGAMRYRAVR
eukprot:g17520.t1